VKDPMENGKSMGEAIGLALRVEAFILNSERDGQWIPFFQGTTIG
jgi:hypothetical protein